MKSGPIDPTATVLAAAALIVMTTQSASAYIDPGTGSYVLQVAIAGLLAAAFVVKSMWQNIKNAVARAFGKDKGNAEK